MPSVISVRAFFLPKSFHLHNPSMASGPSTFLTIGNNQHSDSLSNTSHSQLLDDNGNWRPGPKRIENDSRPLRIWIIMHQWITNSDLVNQYGSGIAAGYSKFNKETKQTAEKVRERHRPARRRRRSGWGRRSHRTLSAARRFCPTLAAGSMEQRGDGDKTTWSMAVAKTRVTSGRWWRRKEKGGSAWGGRWRKGEWEESGGRG